MAISLRPVVVVCVGDWRNSKARFIVILWEDQGCYDAGSEAHLSSLGLQPSRNNHPIGELLSLFYFI